MRLGEEQTRIIRVFNNKRITAAIADKPETAYKSQFEYHWALYLQILKEQGGIKDWEYEPKRFDFWPFGYRNKPYEYTPDFRITDNDNSQYFQELKGYIETKDISRIFRANKHFDAEFEIVLMNLPKKGKKTQLIARANGYAFVRRIYDGSKILKQMGIKER